MLLIYEERIKKKRMRPSFLRILKPPAIFNGFLAHLLEKRMPPIFTVLLLTKEDQKIEDASNFFVCHQ